MLLDEISETVDRIVELSENIDDKTIKQMEDKIDSMITSIYLVSVINKQNKYLIQ